MLKGECPGLPIYSPSIIEKVNTPLPKNIEIPSTCPTFSSLARLYRKHCFWSHCNTTRHKHRYYYNNKRTKSYSEKAVYRLNRHKIFIHFNCRYSFRRFEWCHGFRRHEHTPSLSLHPLQLLPPTLPSPQQQQQQQQQQQLMQLQLPPPQQQQHYQQHLQFPVTLSVQNPSIEFAKSEWIPPINAESLEELSLPHIFKSLQLRHDLLSDPNLCFRPNLDGPSGREKRKKADRYWKRVDSLIIKAMNNEPITSTHFDFIKIIIGELVTILESLVDPFKSISTGFNTFRWVWPTYISTSHLHDVLDPDLILQQILNKCLSIGKQIELLGLIFDAMCPEHHRIRIELMRRYFREQRYAKALDQCFKLLEIIKLDCANRALVHYRNYLIETCAEFEYRYFIKQYSRHAFDLTTTYRWFEDLIQVKNDGFTDITTLKFEEIYYKGLIDLMANETATCFPVTLQFDERRLTHQFRFEFQNMIVIGILLIPYRHLAGKYCHKPDIEKLKNVYTSLLKNSNSNKNSSNSNNSNKNDDGHVSCHNLALHACEAAIQTHTHFHSNILTHLHLTETAHFWEEWLSQHLQPTSSIFKLFYKRISAQLYSFLLQKEKLEEDILDLNDEVEQLGLKLRRLSKLNLDVYGVLYKDMLSQVMLKNK